MTAISMRQKLHQYVEGSDEKLLKLMYALAREYNDDDGGDDFVYEFTTADIASLDQRRAMRLRGESKTYSVEQVRAMITGTDKRDRQ